MEWICQRRIENVPLDRTMILSQIKVFYKELEIAIQCYYSSVWYNKFIIFHGLHLIKTSGGKSSVDIESAELYTEEFEEILAEGNLTVEQIYSSDESSLFWCYIAKKTYILSDKKTTLGF